MVWIVAPISIGAESTDHRIDELTYVVLAFVVVRCDDDEPAATDQDPRRLFHDSVGIVEVLEHPYRVRSREQVVSERQSPGITADQTTGNPLGGQGMHPGGDIDSNDVRSTHHQFGRYGPSACSNVEHNAIRRQMPVESLCKALDPIGATPRSVIVVSDAIEWRGHLPNELMPVAFACALCACSVEASAAVAVFKRAERVFAEVHSNEAQHNGC
jgi:hypothetical protein